MLLLKYYISSLGELKLLAETKGEKPFKPLEPDLHSRSVGKWNAFQDYSLFYNDRFLNLKVVFYLYSLKSRKTDLYIFSSRGDFVCSLIT